LTLPVLSIKRFRSLARRGVVDRCRFVGLTRELLSRCSHDAALGRILR
jgi:hypothetical protein